MSFINKKMLLSFTVNQLSHTNIFLYSSGSSWNRLVSIYLYGSHNLITFFDLNSILFFLRKSLLFSYSVFYKGGSVLTINPDTQNRQIFKRSFEDLPNLFFVNGRWVGGTLTNFRQIFYHLLFMIEYCKLNFIPLKEISPLLVYFRSYFKGLYRMQKLPSCVFVLSYYENYNDHFLRETNILGIPSLGSFNCKENLMLDLCIPSNGSNTQSLEFFSYVIRNSYLATLIKYSEICNNNKNFNFNHISFKKYNSYKFLKKFLYSKLFFLTKKILLLENSSLFTNQPRLIKAQKKIKLFKILSKKDLKLRPKKITSRNYLIYKRFIKKNRKSYWLKRLKRYRFKLYCRIKFLKKLIKYKKFTLVNYKKLKNYKKLYRALKSNRFRNKFENIIKNRIIYRNQNRQRLKKKFKSFFKLDRKSLSIYLNSKFRNPFKKRELKFFFLKETYKREFCKYHYHDVPMIEFLKHELLYRRATRKIKTKKDIKSFLKLKRRFKFDNLLKFKYMYPFIQYANKYFYYEIKPYSDCFDCFKLRLQEKSSSFLKFSSFNNSPSLLPSNFVFFENKLSKNITIPIRKKLKTFKFKPNFLKKKPLKYVKNKFLKVSLKKNNRQGKYLYKQKTIRKRRVEKNNVFSLKFKSAGLKNSRFKKNVSFLAQTMKKF